MHLDLSESRKKITLFYGGVVNLGRNANGTENLFKQFVGIPEMAAADIRLVDLECVIATKGERQLTENHNYFRARPEQTNILVKADTDIVLTANDHSGDYGADALLEQREYLDAAGILYVGSGKNISEAFAPVYKKVGDITVAIFSVDTIMATSAATADKPGTAYLPADNLELWKKTFADKIREAHAKANVVIVAPHWGKNKSQKPSDETQELAHLLIDLGADAVLGCHSHAVQGVENYKNRPIIYDAGDFLFDSGRHNGGCFTLEISSDGVETVKFIPLVIFNCRSHRDKKSMAEIVWDFIKHCNDFKTVTTTAEGGFVGIKFNPPPRDIEVVNEFPSVKPTKNLIAPLAEPKADWIVDKVPIEAITPPKNFNGLKLVGYRVPPECRTMTERKMLIVETYWTIDEPLNKNCRLSITAAPVRECRMLPFAASEHEILDYMFPVERWKVGVIYRERIGLVPPPAKRMANLDLHVGISVNIDGKIVGELKDTNLIKLKIPSGLRYPYWNTEFDDVIYRSEPGKCWTAEQLAKVTGGEWIVPPPKDFYIQSFSSRFDDEKPSPCLLLFNNAGLIPKILNEPNKFVGAMVTRSVKGLPENFPLLKVNDISCATRELGFAARQRFKGKVIGVTGSAGKTTTCNMLSCVFGKDHNILATPGSANVYSNIPSIFAHVKQDDAFAIIEMSINAFAKLPGSITYEITPNVAVVTSIAPAHTGSGGTMENLANWKKNIFCGMAKGDYAVLNRDMPYYEIFEEKAEALNLNIITFGTHRDALIRMPIIENGGAFHVSGKTYKLYCSVPPDQLYDALAVVGVSIAVGFSIEKALEYLKTFNPVKGRGNVLKSIYDGKSLTIIDSTFNANPVSMKYALQHLKNFEPNQNSRVAILGDIADLGNQAIELHKKLADAMIDAETDRILLCGKLMRYPYEMIKNKINVTYFATLRDLLKNVGAYLREGDTVLVKSSHATELDKVVELLSKNILP